MTGDDLDRRVAAVRSFNRFYTRVIGLLHEGYLASPFSLTEVRVLYELAHRERATASQLGRELGLDAGYLSRILHRFGERGLVDRQPSEVDGRRSILRLSEAGQEAFAPLNARSDAEIGALLWGLADGEQERLVEAMRTVERLLGDRRDPAEPYLLRPHRPGDMGWVVHRHGVLYAREYGWDETFEALVASIVAQFVEQLDPARERCWIAERDGQILGSVFVVKASETVARLRLLLVEPEARGLGLGARLVQECIAFSRAAGYRTLTLWTNSVLIAARRIYEKAGFRLVASESHRSFGQDLVGEHWELDL